MDPAKSPRSNKLIQYVGGVVGLGILAFYLYQQFGPPALPKCDAKEARSTLQELIGNTGQEAEKPATGTTVEQISETSYDEAKEIRICAATAKYEDGAEEKLSYRLAWAEKDDSKFAVYPLNLPRCGRVEVQGVLKELIADIEKPSQAPRTLSQIDRISNTGLDAEGATRSCAAAAKFEGGTEQNIAYTVKWNDPEKTQYYVEVEYKP